MTSIEVHNLHDLTSRFLSDTLAADAVQRLEASGENSALVRVVGKPRAELSAHEVRIREGLDELLGYYAIVELAAWARMVPQPLPADFIRAARRHLSHPAVDAYFESAHSLVLVEMLRARLAEQHALALPREQDLTLLFIRFLDTLSLLETSRTDALADARLFVSTLDGVVLDGASVAAVTDLLGNPARFVERVTKAEDRRTILDRAACGLLQVVSFLEHVTSTLEAAEPFQPLAAGMWECYAHWLNLPESRARVEPALREVFHQFADWSAADSTEPSGVASVAELHDALSVLTSSHFLPILKTTLVVSQASLAGGQTSETSMPAASPTQRSRPIETPPVRGHFGPPKGEKWPHWILATLRRESSDEYATRAGNVALADRDAFHDGLAEAFRLWRNDPDELDVLQRLAEVAYALRVRQAASPAADCVYRIANGEDERPPYVEAVRAVIRMVGTCSESAQPIERLLADEELHPRFTLDLLRALARCKPTEMAPHLGRVLSLEEPPPHGQIFEDLLKLAPPNEMFLRLAEQPSEEIAEILLVVKSHKLVSLFPDENPKLGSYLRDQQQRRIPVAVADEAQAENLMKGIEAVNWLEMRSILGKDLLDLVTTGL